MSFILIFKLVVVLIFLIMFLRRPSLSWGVGLLTVTTALLLDTLFGTFDADSLRIELGFFFYAIIGFLLGGAAYWLLGLLWPTLKKEDEKTEVAAVVPATTKPANQAPVFNQVTDENGVLYDLQLIYDDLRTKFNREDNLDLMFDLDVPINAVSNVNGSQDSLAADIVRYAEKNNLAPPLALGVERILTPPTSEMLPRLEKITPDSPRPILRYYLLANFDLDQVQETAAALNIEWEQLKGNDKRSKVRELLRYLYKRQRVEEIVTYLQANEVEAGESTEVT